jgi:hypothetical protein
MAGGVGAFKLVSDGCNDPKNPSTVGGSKNPHPILSFQTIEGLIPLVACITLLGVGVDESANLVVPTRFADAALFVEDADSLDRLLGGNGLDDPIDFFGMILQHRVPSRSPDYFRAPLGAGSDDAGQMVSL